MFESAELGHHINKDAFKAEAPRLRAELLDIQYEVLAQKAFPVIILISGVDGSGKGETINLLYSWMDPRHISTLAFAEPSDEERERPYMWRYWRAL
ncbi:MAG: polyphosphate:AMP phosphotransferase, partial [Azonexus sp.]